MEQSIEKVHSLISAAEKKARDGDAVVAMQLSQAALNAAKAVETLNETEQYENSYPSSR